MTDNELGILIRAELLAGLARQSLSSVLVVANNQPTSQGRVSDSAVYFFQSNDYRYGWQSRKSTYNTETALIDIEEKQIYETTFQVMALSPQDPTNLSLPTAKDIVNACSMIVNSANFWQNLRASGVGVQRVTAIRNPYFVNDNGEFEASPSFDFTVSHNKVIINTAPVVESAELNITRV